MIAQKFTQPLSPDACEISPELLAVQDLMPISAEDRAALMVSIERDGIREPLRGYWHKSESGKRVFRVLSGLNRLEIARELKLPTVPVEAVEIDDKDREAFAIDENRARRQLSLPDKKRLAAWILENRPEMSDRELARQSGLSKNTAHTVREALERRGQIDHVEKRTDSKGRKQAASKPKAPKNTPSDRTGKAQASSVKPGKGAGWPAVSAALVAIRHALPMLTKADKKAARKELERLIQECDL